MLLSGTPSIMEDFIPEERIEILISDSEKEEITETQSKSKFH